ncbi:hypothetical protein GCK32_002782 [Trichostrongylus colubriformis]|uniref:Histone H2A/H2B/H3 domain-containing protein n=1 Tax=Trichostrongylus colubriformis TaxID=6319 RepID=A0AAN8F2P5_TRICO
MGRCTTEGSCVQCMPRGSSWSSIVGLFTGQEKGTKEVDHVKEIAPSVRASKKCASPPQRREGDRCLIPKATFSNYIRGIGKKHTPPPRTMKWSESALSALQKVTEHQLKSMLNKAKTIALLNGRRLVLPRDIYAVSLCAAPSLH